MVSKVGEDKPFYSKPPSQTFFWLSAQSFLPNVRLFVGEKGLHDGLKERLRRRLFYSAPS